MADTRFIKFFDKTGVDMNLGTTASQVNVIYYQTEQDVLTLTGNVYFPRVSTKLVESEQLYILQEVTGPTSSFELRKITGSVSLIGGNPTVTGINSDYTSLTGGVNIQISGQNYTVVSVNGPTSMDISPTPIVSQTTENIYLYDYISYSQPRSSIGTFKEYLNCYFENEQQTAYFLYDIDYTDTVPYIQKTTSASYELSDGSGDSIDSYTGRIQLANTNVDPIQLNVGFSSDTEDIYEENLIVDIERQYIGELVSPPISTSEEITIIIGGTSQLPYIYATSKFFLQGVTGATSVTPFYEEELIPVAIGVTGSDTYLVFESKDITTVPVSSIANYRLLWKNTSTFAKFSLYGETEGEDERFRLVLENFGKKIDFDKEYIFRESDINEGLPDYKLLNVKRKELLLEGDTIYPYMGSYRSLINVINYFGYYDLEIKEYFLNVDENSSNYGKFMHLLIPRNEEQRQEVKKAWQIVPSTIYKKTSLFGLFYDLNRTTEEYDEEGLPVVEDAFMFSPEEVLIKLFGLKELLKEQYLPLNARIVDITGEGIYFEKIKVDSWADNLNHRVINLGTLPEFTIEPSVSYISDIRRLDQFYIQKFVEQGLTGFLGAGVDDPSLTAEGFTGPISELFGTSIIDYSYFVAGPCGADGNLFPVRDNIWEFMPPGISNPNFNDIAKRLEPLPESDNVLAGAPLLLEAKFDISWEEGEFSWAQLGILGPTGSPLNINIWTWESIGQGEYIDMRWTVEKHGHDPFFYDTGRAPIENYRVGDDETSRILHAVCLPYEGEYQIGLYIYDITNNFTMQFNKHVVKNRNIDFVSIFRMETSERTWADFEKPLSSSVPDHLSFGEIPTSGARLTEWDEVTGPWYYPLHVVSSWEDAKISWDSLGFSQYKDQTLFESPLVTSLLEIERNNEYVILSGDLTSIFDNQDSLFFVRNEADLVQSNIEVPVDAFDVILAGTVSGFSGATSLSTVIPVTGITSGSSIFVDNSWYDVNTISTVGPVSIIEILQPLQSNITGSTALYYNSSKEINVNVGTTCSMNVYSRLIFTDSLNYENIDPTVNFYSYLDGLTSSGSIITLKADDSTIRKTILKNSSLGAGATLYTSWGLFSGTYALPITGAFLTNGNTRVQLQDVNKELYNIDGNFTIANAEYDVDYAEYRIGINSLNYEGADEITWEDSMQSWYGLEYHSGTLCGYVIPFVSPGGSITVDEFPSFDFSGDIAIQNTKSGLQAAANELNASENEGISKYTYSRLPEDELYIYGSTGATVTSGASMGSTCINVNVHPVNFSIPGRISVTISGGSVSTVNIDSGGYGYNVPPTIEVSHPGGTGTAAIITCSITNGIISGTSIVDSGSGYLSAPVVEVAYPENHRELDNAVWTGKEWLVIDKYVYVTKQMYLESGRTVSITFASGTSLLLPYEYHKQLIRYPSLLQQFYFFVQGKAKNPSSEMLSYISMKNGVGGEWATYPDRTYTYPLRNSIWFGSERGDDQLYEKWVYEGSDYPPLSVFPEYSSDKESLQARIPYMQTLQSPYSYNDTVISSSQQIIPKFTPVMFSFENCRIPGKKNPKWTITNDESGVIQVISTSPNLMWNFTKDGNFSVSLELEDSNGNRASGNKTSFVVIGKPEKYEEQLERRQIKPTVTAEEFTPSINIA